MQHNIMSKQEFIDKYLSKYIICNNINMSDFKLANTVISDVKLGGAQVSKIYNGNVLVWPQIPDIITGEDPFGGDTRTTGTLEYVEQFNK